MSVLLVLFSYLLGSISFSYFITKRIKGVDIRKVGSGNAGATNISRVLGLKFALLVLFLDTLKGFVVALLASYLTPDTLLFLLCCGAVIIGHNWPVFFGFKGRGVATTLGVFLVIAPIHTLIVLSFLIVIIVLTRYVSLGSIIGAISAPVVLLLLRYPFPYFIFAWQYAC